MKAPRTIDGYLAVLSQGLPRRGRARVVAEAEDHLRCAMEVAVAEGESAATSERRAIERFGTVDEVVAAHLRAASRTATRSLIVWALLSVLPFGAMFFAATQVASIRVGAPAQAVSSGVAGAAGWVGVQVAAACLLLAIVRGVLMLRDAEPSRASLQLAGRSAGTAIGVVAVVLALDLDAFHRMPAGHGQHAALVFGLALASMLTTAVALARLAITCRLVARLGARASDHDEPSTVLAELRWAGVIDDVARAFARRPWWSASATAAVVGLGVGLSHLVAEGAPAQGAAVGLLVVAVLAALEGGLVFACYLVLGAFLGIRRPLNA